jgi:adenosylhomocysteinase
MTTRIADSSLAASGHERIAWARRFMPVSALLADQLAATGKADGVRIGISMVLEPKTAVLCLLLSQAGAAVSVYAHADETDDDVAAALAASGLDVFARSDANFDGQRELALQFLDMAPDILVDDGSSLIRLAHIERPGLVAGMIGAAEETTSGLRPLRLMQAEGVLACPVIAVNDAKTKTLFDNRYGTGQSCVFAILDLLDGLEAASAATNTPSVTSTSVVSGATMLDKRVVVAGFGHVGQGVAAHCAALGGRVTIAETDSVRALQARFAGYEVETLVTAAASADIVISATGIARTVGLDILEACAPDAVIAVAGGVPQEIAIDDAIAAGATRSSVAHKIERFRMLSGGSVLILDDGGCINITAGGGNPIEIMDLSFGVQLAAISFLLDEGKKLAPGVYPLEPEVDATVARAALAASGLGIDAASGRQEDFLNSWVPTRFVAETS